MNAGYVHKVDKSQIPTCKILGVDIAAINMEWLVGFTLENIRELSGDYMCVSNVHTTVSAYEDAAYRSVQNGGVMAIPDGGPLSSLGQKRGCRDMRRTTGPDYMRRMLEAGVERGYRHFFYGSTPQTLERMRERLMEEYPGGQVAGMYSPPFRDLTESEDADITRRINEAGADFIWVGLGAPKQEVWMAEHQGKVKGFMVGVGAGFDYLAGNIERAPEWMQKHNLEWLYRLYQEPGKLWKRYMRTNTRFVWHAVVRGR